MFSEYEFPHGVPYAPTPFSNTRPIFRLSGTAAKTITNNEAETGDGGGIWVASGAEMLTESSATGTVYVTNNRALDGDGGGIFTENHGNYPDPLPTTGGVVTTVYQNLTLLDINFSGNQAYELHATPLNANTTTLPDITWNSITAAAASHPSPDHPINNYDINWNSGTVTFEFTKTDDVPNPYNGIPLGGAVFQLFRRTSNLDPWTPVPGQQTSDSTTGRVSFELTTYAYYRLVEVIAPAGFQAPFGYWLVTVGYDATNNEAIFVFDPQGNAPPFRDCRTAPANHNCETCDDYGCLWVGNRTDFELPLTGGRGSTATTAIFATVGLVLIGIGTGTAFVTKAKKNMRSKS